MYKIEGNIVIGGIEWHGKYHCSRYIGMKKNWDEEDVEAVTEAIKAGMNWAVGPNIEKFEKMIGEYNTKKIYEKLKLIKSHGRLETSETSDYFSSTEYAGCRYSISCCSSKTCTFVRI